MSLLTGFKKFLIRGNAVDLAVGFVVGAAFTSVVKALVADIFTPLIALIFGKPNFEALSFTVNHSHFLYGDLVNNLFTFLDRRRRSCTSSWSRRSRSCSSAGRRPTRTPRSARSARARFR